MLEAACALTVDLATRGVVLPDGIAVNVSGRQLANPRAAQALLRILDRHGLAGTAVTVEITEGAEVAGPGHRPPRPVDPPRGRGPGRRR